MIRAKISNAPLNREQFGEMFFSPGFLKILGNWVFFLSFQPPSAGCSMPKKILSEKEHESYPYIQAKFKSSFHDAKSVAKVLLRTYLKKMLWSLLPDWILWQKRIKCYFVTESMTVCLYSLFRTTSLGFPFLAFPLSLIPWNKANETAKRNLTARPSGKKWDDM